MFRNMDGVTTVRRYSILIDPCYVIGFDSRNLEPEPRDYIGSRSKLTVLVARSRPWMAKEGPAVA